MQSCQWGGPQDPHSAPASLIEDLRSAQSSTYTVTFLLCMASLYGDPRSAQTSAGQPSPLCEGGPAFPDEIWVPFVRNACVAVATARRGCFAVSIWGSEQSRSGRELPAGKPVYAEVNLILAS